MTRRAIVTGGLEMHEDLAGEAEHLTGLSGGPVAAFEVTLFDIFRAEQRSTGRGGRCGLAARSFPSMPGGSVTDV